MNHQTRKLDVTVGPWAREKLLALGQYLEFYTTVLKHQAWLRGTIFIDGFAGAGYSEIRVRRAKNQPSLLASEIDEGQAQLIAGSPRVALEVKNPFSWYLFIEQNPARAAELKKLQSEYSEQSIRTETGDAGEMIRDVIGARPSWKKYRGVAFLDPFGTHLDWSTVASLAATGAFEVLINFPLQMAIQRLIPKEGEIDPDVCDQFDCYFGTPSWRDAVYHQVAGLFGEQKAKYSDYGPRLLKLYMTRLEEAFGHVSAARLICNTRKHPLYYLVWAGPHKKGLEGAEHILTKGRHVSLPK